VTVKLGRPALPPEERMRRERDRWKRYKPHINPRRRLSRYKFKAKLRGYSWEISDSHALALFNGSCQYCGAAPNPLNGIDRVDNSKGYKTDNVVSCCTPCNYKKNSISLAFAAAILRAAGWNIEHQPKKEEEQ